MCFVSREREPLACASGCEGGLRARLSAFLISLSSFTSFCSLSLSPVSGWLPTSTSTVETSSKGPFPRAMAALASARECLGWTSGSTAPFELLSERQTG